MLNSEYSTQYKRDYKKAKSQNKDISALKTVMAILINELPIPAKYRDHPLIGKYKGFNELHIETDWLLIYRIANNTVYFTRTGSHSELFGK